MVGNDRVVRALQQDVAEGTLPHALILCGPEGTGKTRLALELAKALNCIGDDAPCQRCLHCRQIESRGHPDISVVERPEGKNLISIEQVRELRESASLRAYQGRRKVYIIDGAEALTAQASDALLKILEEPPEQVIHILTVSDIDSLPATILSRCRLFILQPVTNLVIEQLLAERGQPADTVKRLARLARGRVGWALRAQGDPKFVTQHEEMVGSLSTLLDLDLDSRLQMVERLLAKKDRSQVRRVLELLVLIARDLLYMSLGVPAVLTSGDEEDRLRKQAQRLGARHVHAYLRSLHTAMERIEQNVDPRLALEAAVLVMP